MITLRFRNRLNGPIEANALEDEMAIVDEPDSIEEDLLSGIWLSFAQVIFLIRYLMLKISTKYFEGASFVTIQ